LLEALTVNRTLRVGWRYLVIGTAIPLILTIELLISSNRAIVFPTTFPLEVPIFAVLGSTAGLMTFTSDRAKGVFEYLLAYGIQPRTLFMNGLLAALAMSAIILSTSLAIGVGGAVAEGVALKWNFEEAILLYTLPMAFAGALFTSTIGMIWSSVSSPRSGFNSPVGIAPMFGVAPTILVLIIAETVPTSEYYWVTGGAAAIIVVAVLVLLALSARLLGRERFLSPL